MPVDVASELQVMGSEFDSDESVRRIGRFELRNSLGSGGMGTVFAAWDTQLKREVALKVIRPRPDGDRAEVTRRRVLREARAMARLQHPNVITVFEAGIIEDQAFIAMEYVRGTTLWQWLTAQPRGWQEVLDIFLAAGQGLVAAHEAGLIHRDFKPENVLIDERGWVKVTDFGLVRALDSGAPLVTVVGDATPEARLRASPTECQAAGTPGYMAPEQFSEGEVGALADQFGFCAALFDALFGQQPFAGDSIDELFDEMYAGRIRRPADMRGVPKWLYQALERGLRFAPERRYSSLQQLLSVLETGLRGNAPPAEPERAERSKLARSWPWVAIGAFLLGLGIAGWALWHFATNDETDSTSRVSAKPSTKVSGPNWPVRAKDLRRVELSSLVAQAVKFARQLDSNAVLTGATFLSVRQGTIDLTKQPRVFIRFKIQFVASGADGQQEVHDARLVVIVQNGALVPGVPFPQGVTSKPYEVSKIWTARPLEVPTCSSTRAYELVVQKGFVADAPCIVNLSWMHPKKVVVWQFTSPAHRNLLPFSVNAATCQIQAAAMVPNRQRGPRGAGGQNELFDTW